MEWFNSKNIKIGSTEDLRKDYHRTLHKKTSLKLEEDEKYK